MCLYMHAQIGIPMGLCGSIPLILKERKGTLENPSAQQTQNLKTKCYLKISNNIITIYSSFI